MENVKVICNNKKAYHNYFVTDKYEAGIVLLGSEVKSVRAGSVNINDAFVQIKDNIVYLKNAYIKEYDKATVFKPDTLKNRNLLLNKREIAKMRKSVEQKGNTIIPLKMYFKNGIVKLEIGVCVGKKLYDKRETLKQKTIQKHINQEMKRL